MWRCVVGRVVPDVSMHRSAFIFRIKQSLGLFDAKDTRITTLRNVGTHARNDTASHAVRRESSNIIRCISQYVFRTASITKALTCFCQLRHTPKDPTTDVHNIASTQGQSAAHIPKAFLQHISQDNDLASESSAINNMRFVSPCSLTFRANGDDRIVWEWP